MAEKIFHQLDRFITTLVLDDVFAERERQTEKWGVQHHPDGTGEKAARHGMPASYGFLAQHFKLLNDNTPAGGHKWDTILLEEVYEALSETDHDKLREELVQVAAVAVAWIEDIDSRKESK